MPTASISTLWSPAVWIRGINEKLATYPGLFTSGAVVANPYAQELASGKGTIGDIPFFKDITDQADEIQVEGAGPSTINGITAGVMKAVVCNRQTKNQAEALASAVTGDDPVGGMTGWIGMRRLKQRQATMLSILRGAFGTGVGHALGNAACLSGVRQTVALEAGASPAAGQLIDADKFIDTCALLGELQNDLRGGVIFMHSAVQARLKKLDAASFKNGVQSGLPFNVNTYRDIPIVVSDALVRAGTTSGFVYDTYILVSGVFAYGEKPQSGDTIDVASLQFDMDKEKNSEVIYDRTRFVIHPNGLRYGGSPAGQSPTNAELMVIASWTSVLTSVNRAGMACIVTNG